jgi:putative acetyltransferase
MIRGEESTDGPAVRAIVAAAFRRRDEADLVDRLRADGDAIRSLVAFDRTEVVGHVVFSKVVAPFRAVALGPVAVRPDHQRVGIGSRLIRAGLEQSRAEGWQGVFVLGDPAYYQRFGFDPGAAAAFTSPYAGPHFMVLALDARLPVTEGVIEYAPAFALLDSEARRHG